MQNPRDPIIGAETVDKLLELNNIPVGRRFVMAAGVAVLALPGVAVAASRAVAVASTMRLHDHSTHTRMVLELSGEVDFSLFRLADPFRVVIDLPELDWAVGNAVPGPTGLVSAVRFGVFQQGVGRIVVDLAGPANIKNAFVLPATGGTPSRFVVDLEPMPRDGYMKLLGPQHRMGNFGGASAQVQARAQTVEKAKPSQVELEDKETGRKKIIAIDPGHGGVDPGAIGVSGIYEKIITLAAAKQLKARLEGTGRYKVVLTRENDVSLGLAERREIARAAKADLFISLHADSMSDRSMRGLSVYTLSEKASDKEAAALAEQENSADSIIGVDLSHESQEVRHILVDLAQRESMNIATRVAARLIDELQRETTLVRNSHRFARFAVLKSPDVPSVLIEMGYLSNRQDETALKKDAYRAKLVGAVTKAINSHFGPTQNARR